ncbi:hypothetical protein RclHR1_00040018 [Rhizophagus clarus]|uniref:Uncharacterized protein n=1 Tax=Rhizophagus clarus TaxID=94130 RepID=A0A2Z6S8R2_9GLOM|nr:hypothetical protein RclHR1_00040018 [Rhizophagus clarus]GES91708.1 hypothetical protein RCL_e17305_RclHR1_00040018 [Rhizophagus clarus]
MITLNRKKGGLLLFLLKVNSHHNQNSEYVRSDSEVNSRLDQFPENMTTLYFMYFIYFMYFNLFHVLYLISCTLIFISCTLIYFMYFNLFHVL